MPQAAATLFTTGARGGSAVLRSVRSASSVRPTVRQLHSSSRRKSTAAASSSSIDVLTSGALQRASNGTPYSVRASNILPLSLVERKEVKRILPLLGNAAYAALASGFLMTDILVLRCLLVTGYTGLVGFHLLHPRPLRIPLKWSAFFVAVNIGMTVQLVMERFPVGLTEEDKALLAAFFSDKFTPAQFKWFLDLGERRTLPAGTRLTSESRVCGTLYFVEGGNAALSVQGTHVANIGRGGFVNDVAFQQGEGAAAGLLQQHCTHSPLQRVQYISLWRVQCSLCV